MKTPLGTEVDFGPGHIVLDRFHAARERGTAPPPLLGPCLLWPRSPISATAELLFINWLSFPELTSRIDRVLHLKTERLSFVQQVLYRPDVFLTPNWERISTEL